MALAATTGAGLEEIAEDEEARSRARGQREKAIDQFYEEGDPAAYPCRR